MTNAELLDKIKAEIERLKGIGGIVPLDNREQKTGYESALIDIETFLSTLESEKPMNPEAAMKELDEKIALVKQRGTWDDVDVDKYIDEVRGREPEKPCHTVEEWMEHIKNADALTKAIFSKGPYNVLYDALNHPYRDCYDAIKEFGELCYQTARQDMLKEAVEKTVGQEETIIAGHPVWGKMIALTEVDLKGFEYGDKVRVIVCKMEDR